MANDIEIKVKVANQTQAGLASINRSMDGLRTHARAASTSLSGLAPRALAAAAALDVLRHSTDGSADALQRLRSRAAATGASLLETRTSSTSLSTSLRSVARSSASADGRMETMTARTRALRDDMNELNGAISRVGGSMGGLRGSLGSLGSSAGGASGGQRGLMMAALALAPALIPVAAAAAPIAPVLGAAAVAMAAFGAALVPQILAMGKITEAEKAYTQSLAENGRFSKATAQAESEWLKQVQKSSPEVRKAAASLSVMKEQYKAWSDSLARDTLPVATKSFAAFGALFPKMTPLVQGASGQLSRFMTIAAGGIESSGFGRFMDSFATFATETLAKANSGLVRFATSLDAGKMSGGVAEFMRFAKQNGPLVAETLGNLGQALGRLVHAASETGVSLLTVVNAFANLVNALPIGLLSTLLQVAIAMKAVSLASAGMAVAGPALTAAAAGVQAFIRAAQFGGVASAIAGVTQRLSALAKVGIVVGVIAGIAYAVNELAEKARGAPPDVDKLTTSLKELGATGKFGGELKKSFGDMDGLVKKIGQLSEESKKAGEAAKGAFGFKIPVLDDIGNWLGTKFTEMHKGQESFRALKDEFKGLDAAMSQAVKGGNGDLAARTFADIAAAAQAGGRSLDEVKGLLPGYGEALKVVGLEQEIAARAMGAFGEQAIAVQAKLDMQKQSAAGLAQSINALNETYLQARGGVRGMEAAIDAATESLKKNGQTLDEDTEKGRANAQSLDNLAAATMKATEATLINGAGWEAAQAVWERGRGQLLVSAQAMGLTEAQAKSLADQILATPNKTAVLKGNMEDLQNKLESAKAQLLAVPDSRKAAIRAEIADLEAQLGRARALLGGMKTDYEVRVHYRQIGYIPSGGHQLEYAHGGVIGAAGGGPRSRMTLVGEQGPELVDLAPGSRVRSNPDSRRIAAGMGGGGGGTGQPLVIQLHVNGKVLAQETITDLRQLIRIQGGDVQQVLGSRNR